MRTSSLDVSIMTSLVSVLRDPRVAGPWQGIPTANQAALSTVQANVASSTVHHTYQRKQASFAANFPFLPGQTFRYVLCKTRGQAVAHSLAISPTQNPQHSLPIISCLRLNRWMPRTGTCRSIDVESCHEG
ncbi:hypothetical protein M407DRAFT_177474 [Tulasnella calospora MUT 4182]|uniref:Uncharacterized protein n=1 Tax=Tulasnella calospora MUT 4182 TaxID=1051891 RepID=A0A0C3QLQ8_9AGAM|nr:hypothetical protein M407DRAFT_177474 [Tulasnella calospora MUT 4182]